jgi:hypothetical protein
VLARAVMLVAIVVPIRARADCDAPALRAELARESARARTWNLVWGLSYAGVAVGSAALAIVPTMPTNTRDALLVTTGKATLGAVSRAVVPARIVVPDSSSCDELLAALRRAARIERTSFWMLNIGGLAVNLAGAAVIARVADWRLAATSLALGVPVGLLSTYTLPRRAWKHARALSAIAVPTRGGWQLAIGGAF